MLSISSGEQLAMLVLFVDIEVVETLRLLLHVTASDDPLMILRFNLIEDDRSSDPRVDDHDLQRCTSRILRLLIYQLVLCVGGVMTDLCCHHFSSRVVQMSRVVLTLRLRSDTYY